MAFYIFNNFNPSNKTERHTLKEWELHTGIKVVNPKGFVGDRNKIRTNLYNRRAFKRGIKSSIITIKTEKGLEFLNLLHKEGPC